MTEWNNTWQLNFNSDKCEVMRITHQKDFSLPDYNLSGKKLKVVNEFKDLGVIMTSNLSWSNQVASSVKKANRILGLIKRTVGSFTSTSTFTTLYKSLVRPLLEYAAPVWSPHLVKDIQALEAVQRRASRLALKQRRGEMPYEDRCELLKWNTLEKRREFLSLVECYKTVFGLNGISFAEVFEYKQYRATRTNHAYTLYPKRPRINCFKHSFFVRIISLWNNLPRSVVEVYNIKNFKNNLKLHMKLH
jgi:hypothetical protein